MQTRPTLLYATAIFIVIGWWYLAFKPASFDEAALKKCVVDQASIKQPPLLASLAPLDRNLLQAGLSGNTGLMAQLIADWDVDAQLLEIAVPSGIKRLPRHSYLRSQVLGRQLIKSSPEQLQALRNRTRVKHVLDDKGDAFPLELPPTRFLPQTYVAASFLLSLSNVEQIVALPKGLREHVHLFPKTLTDKIPRDIDRYNSETLYLAQPQVAFVSHYSHPCAIEALRKQGIQLFNMDRFDSIADICDMLTRFGQVIDRSLEAELLTLFMEAALQTIDNRMLALQQSLGENVNSRVMFLNYHAQYSIPTLKTVTGQLLQRLGISPFLDTNDDSWRIPVDQEQIVNFNPDCLIIATSDPKALEAQIVNTPAFAQLKALQQARLFFVDDTIQQFPSQYMVLAYYDLYNAIAMASLL